MMMNVENILKVADAIEQHLIPGLGFNMANWFSKADHNGGYRDQSGHNCGTVACVAGWAAAVADRRKRAPKKVLGPGSLAWSAEERAMKFFDIGFAVSEPLFYGEGADKGRDDITAEQAVATLRHLAKTGKVNWRARSAKAA